MSEIKQTVPQDLAVRQKIRQAATDLVLAAGLIPPISLLILKHHTEQLVNSLCLDDCGFDHYTMIMLNNAVWETYFPHIALNQRLLLLPFCLRKQPECTAEHDELGLICNGCGQCSIPAISDAADALDMPVLIAESSSMVSEWVERGDIQAVVGISCMESLEKSFPAMISSAVPGFAIPLLRDGCKDTVFDSNELRAALAIPQDNEVHVFSYHAIRDTIDTLFSARGLEYFMPENMLREESVRALCDHGKHYRPLIALGCYAALMPTQTHLPEYMKPIALAVECFHKASLIHDDIEDGDEVRYQEPTLYKRVGLATALNIGDYLIGLGYKFFCHDSIPPGKRTELTLQASLAHCELSLGQAREFDALQSQNLHQDDCLEIYRLKTSPAFRVALFAGAIAAGRFHEFHKLLQDFSNELGVAYQLYDDLEDSDGNPASIVDVLMNTNGWDRETAREKTILMYATQKEKIYELLEHLVDVPLKIYLYRLTGKVLKDV